MSTTNKSIIFLVLTFAISWTIAIGGWSAGTTDEPLGAVITLFGMMMGPAIAAIICTFAFEKDRRIIALGLKFKPSWWLLFAYLIGLALCAGSVAFTVLLSDRQLGDLNANILLAAEQAGQDTSRLQSLPLVPLVLFQALVVGSLINSVMTLSEELGWRGYLHYLWRPGGFWRTSLVTGAVWGVWHAPAIYLMGHNYPSERVLGVGMFVGFCMLLAPIMTLVRDRAGSVWSAGILHGTINAAGGVTALALSNPAFPWSGLTGIGGFVALALGAVIVALLPQKTAEPTPTAATAA
ncbi:MAG: CPBP family intramembrane glutamic endopeptidase [Hyphomonadaceae bacterium]